MSRGVFLTVCMNGRMDSDSLRRVTKSNATKNCSPDGDTSLRFVAISVISMLAAGRSRRRYSFLLISLSDEVVTDAVAETAPSPQTRRRNDCFARER